MQSLSINATVILAMFAWTCVKQRCGNTLWRPVTTAHAFHQQAELATLKSSWGMLVAVWVSYITHANFPSTSFYSSPSPLNQSLSLLWPNEKEKTKKAALSLKVDSARQLWSLFERASLTESISLQSDLDCWRWASLERTLGGDRP